MTNWVSGSVCESLSQWASPWISEWVIESVSQIGTPEWHPVYVGRKKRQLPSEPLLHWRVLFSSHCHWRPGWTFRTWSSSCQTRRTSWSPVDGLPATYKKGKITQILRINITHNFRNNCAHMFYSPALSMISWSSTHFFQSASFSPLFKKPGCSCRTAAGELLRLGPGMFQPQT